MQDITICSQNEPDSVFKKLHTYDCNQETTHYDIFSSLLSLPPHGAHTPSSTTNPQTRQLYLALRQALTLKSHV